MLLTTQRLSQQGARTSAPTPPRPSKADGRRETSVQRLGSSAEPAKRSLGRKGLFCLLFSLYITVSLKIQVLNQPLQPAASSASDLLLLKVFYSHSTAAQNSSFLPLEVCGPCNEDSGCAKGA